MDIWNLKGGQLSFLNQNEIEEIHQRSLDILQEVGCYMDHEKALEILKANGAVVDASSKIVKIPRNIVENALRCCPSSMLLAARDPKRDIHAEGDRVYFGTGTVPVNVIDLETGKYRKGLNQDCHDFARLIDALDYIHFFKSMICPSDVNQRVLELYMLYGAYQNTTKQISSTSFSVETAMDQYRMGVAVAGGEQAFRQRPMLLINFLAVSPLSYDYKALGGIIGAAQKGYPMIIGSDPQGGTTGPAPLAGQLVVNTAESLAGITLAQIVNPGVPVMWGNIGSVAEMRTGVVATGAIELALINSAFNQMAKFYRLPTYSTGGMTDSKTSDAQAAVEKSLQALTVALAGGNYIHNASGIMDFSLSCSYEQYVIDNEMLGMVCRVLSGIQVNPDTLSLDEIRAVGPRGNFMGLRHTLKHVREGEHYLPWLFDRATRDTWISQGARDIQQVARERARAILSKHTVPPLPAEVDKELKAIIENAENTYGRS
jgi:trimethylamine--corrinoid protein Co-methyltransferase